MKGVLTEDEKKKIEELLANQYGIVDGLKNYVVIASGENRIRITHREVLEFSWRLKNIANIGLYVAKLSEDELSLSIEGAQLFSSMIKKNVVDLSLDDAKRWMRGEALKIDAPSSSRYVVAKCGDVFLGTGRVGRDGLVYPQIPRNRLTRQGTKSAEDL
jgi:NOL1/NOP2/fmu family ribosome biogenesis protein